MILRMRDLLNEMLADDTGQGMAKIHQDTDRDFIMSAEEARRYGVIDEVIRNGRPSAARLLPSARPDGGGQRWRNSGDGGELVKCSFCGKSRSRSRS